MTLPSHPPAPLRRLGTGLRRRDAVHAIQEARQPRPQRRDDDQLRGTADAHPQHGARAHQQLADVQRGLTERTPLGVELGLEFDGAVVAHLQVQQRDDQPGYADDAEGRLPPPVAGDVAAEQHAEHRTDRGRGEEAGEQRTAHARREMAGDQRRADRAVAGLAEADDRAQRQQRAVATGPHARDRGQAPERRHHDDALDAAGAVGDQRHRQSAQCDRDRHHRHQGAELLVGQIPLGLDEGEQRDDDLAVDIVEDHQRQRHRAGKPGRAGAEQVVVFARAALQGMQVHCSVLRAPARWHRWCFATRARGARRPPLRAGTAASARR